MNDPQYYDPNQPQPYDPNQGYYDPNQGYYDPNQPQPVGGMPPAGYTRVQAPKKAGDKYKGAGKKGKRPKDPRAPNPWANMGIWAVGLGLPLLLIYFAIDKLFMDKISVETNPYPPVLFEKEDEKKLVTMGQDIAAALREGRKDDLQRHVLWEEVTYRVSRNMELDLGQSTVVRDEIKAHWTADIPGLFRQIMGSDGDRVSAQFVRVRQRDGYPCVLIRTMPKPDRVYYFDLLIVPAKTVNANGDIIGEERLRILDIWDCQRAMFASDAVRREVILELPTEEAKHRNRAWKAVFGQELTKEQILAIKSMIPSDVLNKPSTIQDLKELPDFVQNSPQGYDIAIHAYQKLFDGLATAEQLEAYKARLNNPPTLPESLGPDALVTGNLLAEVEAKLENKDAVDAALLKAYKQIGSDPYLKVMIGKRRVAAGDIPGAEAMVNEVNRENRNLPELQDLKNALEKKRNP